MQKTYSSNKNSGQSEKPKTAKYAMILGAVAIIVAALLAVQGFLYQADGDARITNQDASNTNITPPSSALPPLPPPYSPGSSVRNK